MTEVVYSIDEQPRHWWETLLYGWQHTLVDISPFVLPLAVATAIGLDDGARAALINYSLIAMGLATLIQTTVGNRLPIVQGPSATLTGTLAPLAGRGESVVGLVMASWGQMQGGLTQAMPRPSSRKANAANGPKSP